jgi:hypothetical protein
MQHLFNNATTVRVSSRGLRWLSAIVFATSLQAQTPERIFQGAMTSSGRNRPSINLGKDDLLKLCALLHLRVPIGELPGQLGISEEELRRRVDVLVGEGLARRLADQRVVTTAVVVTIDDAPKDLQPDDHVVESAARMMLKKLPAVRAACRKLESLADVPFEPLSFFVMSDALLDNWQISNVERLFVKAERTLRTGGRYYYTILEKPATVAAEPFGLYGNTGSQWGSVQIGLYGNDRFSGHTLLSIREADFNRTFGFEKDVNTTEVRRELADRIVGGVKRGPGSLTPTQQEALSRLELIKGDKLAVILLRDSDYKALDQVAALVTKDLVTILDRTRARVHQTYETSPYAEETSFNEYLMCWYQFFYAAVTNRLRDKGAISIPPNGNVTNVVVK